MIFRSPKKYFSQDETGQWWLQLSRARTRISPKPCVRCGVEFLAWYKQPPTEHCSRSCARRDFHGKNPSIFAKENAARWNGGKFKNRHGYIMVHAPDHPNCQGNLRKYVLEHRLVMEKTLGRYLERYETVHHKNGDRTDNRPENLELWAQRRQPPGQRVTEQKHCPTCTCGSH
jgi:hypothetical protein